MKNQLLNRSLLSGKARMVSFFAGLFLIAMPAFSNAATVSFGVTFGNPQSNGGVCVGKGVCRETLDLNASEAVNVTFTVNDANPNVLIMSFSMSELTAKQPEKANSFSDPLGYSFDSPYSLMKPMYSDLHLMPGAMVMSDTRYATTISGDQVSVYIPYAHTN